MWTALTILLLAAASLQSLSAIQKLSARDRPTQAEAVDALVAQPGCCEADLLGVWRSTTRFDVRAHIARVFARRGTAGVPALLELTRDIATLDASGESTLVVDALAASGTDVLPMVTAEIERPDGHVAVLLMRLLDRLGTDSAPIVRDLLASPSPSARAAAVNQLLDALPARERLTAIVDAANDHDSRVRNAAAQRLSNAAWSRWLRQDRVDAPEAFVMFTTTVTALLESPDENVVRGAVIALRAIGGTANSPLPTVRAIAGDPRWTIATRAEAMRTLVALDSDPQRAVAFLLTRLDSDPLATCGALSEIEPSVVPDAAIPKLVTALKARGREETPCADVLVRIGVPAISTLVAAVDGRDEELAGCAAEALGRIGPAAAPAIPHLIQRLDARPKGWLGDCIVHALFSIGIDDARVREAIARLLQRQTSTSPDLSAAGTAVERLVRLPDSPTWAKALIEPIVLSPNHPLRPWALSVPRPIAADAIALDEAQLIAALRATEARDRLWAFACGRGGQESDAKAWRNESKARVLAAGALKVVERPSDAVIAALVVALRNDIVESPQPPEPRADETAPATTTRFAMWQGERVTAALVAHALATLMDQDPAVLRRAFDGLSDRPVALMLVATSWVNDSEQPARYVNVPADVAEPVAATLVRHATVATRGTVLQRNVIQALCRLPTSDARRTEVLLELIRFGEGDDAPVAALEGLGRTWPVTALILDVLHEHLSDPRADMRRAAIRGAMHAEHQALPLLADVIALGRHWLTTVGGFEAVEAVRAIAPDDPRSIEFVNDYWAANPRHLPR